MNLSYSNINNFLQNLLLFEVYNPGRTTYKVLMFLEKNTVSEIIPLDLNTGGRVRVLKQKHYSSKLVTSHTTVISLFCYEVHKNTNIKT